jgi:hypothetical protein
MSCPTITTIDPTWCIGNSLDTINSNFTNLSGGICDNLSLISALTNQINALSNTITNLQAGVAKAWAYNLADGTIQRAYNIASVQKVNVPPATGTTGAWKYTFTTAMPTSSYCIVATAGDSYHLGGTIVTTTVASQTRTDFTIICDGQNATTYPNGCDTSIYVTVFSY